MKPMSLYMDLGPVFDTQQILEAIYFALIVSYNIELNIWKSNFSPNNLQNFIPRAELPISSNLGDQVAIPITFGITIIIAPATPDLEGIPILKANSPE